MTPFAKNTLLQIIIFILCTLLFPKTSQAIEDPLTMPNNKFGIHIITPTPNESSPAADLVNTNGDWGYITFLIESKDRNKDKWQTFFNDLRKRHLIPIVRLATQPENGVWKRPYEKEEIAWADFLDNLNWPTKNRYIIIYNEPNHATEWGATVDAKDYAKTLDKTITALKQKNKDFFVLNAGFDASAPQKLPAYQDQLEFMKQMNQEVPGIFNKLDGWSSHSYPNPAFKGSPDDSGRGTIRNYFWEIQVLQSLGVSKNLPIFITETGWRHSQGKTTDHSLPSPETVTEYYKKAFQQAWANDRIIAVTPFLLNYQDHPFDHFSFKKISGEKQSQTLPNTKILGYQFPDYHPQYYALKDLPKVIGKPKQEEAAELVKGEIYHSIVVGEKYSISLTFKNIGQSIWNEYTQIKLVPDNQSSKKLSIKEVLLPKDIKIEPQAEYTFNIDLQAPQGGDYLVTLNLISGDNIINKKPLTFNTQVKSPVYLTIKSKLKWKNDFTGQYILDVAGTITHTFTNLILNTKGQSSSFEARQLLPDLTYDFTLKRPFYKPKTIRQTVKSGENTLDFGELQPDITSAILYPRELWSLLPFSN